jgi:hypothetical protein
LTICTRNRITSPDFSDKSFVGVEFENLSSRCRRKKLNQSGGKSSMSGAIGAGIWQHAAPGNRKNVKMIVVREGINSGWRGIA